MIAPLSNILAKGDAWIGFAVLIVVWGLGVLANWLKKTTDQQGETELRRQARENIQRKAQVFREQIQRRAQAARQGQISEGISNRFPDVLLPPAPQQPRRAVQQRRAAPPLVRRAAPVVQSQPPRVAPPPVPVVAAAMQVEEISSPSRKPLSAQANQI